MDKRTATPLFSGAGRFGSFIRLFILFVLVALFSFALGRLSVIEEEKAPVTIEYDFPEASYETGEPDLTEEIPRTEGAVVSSQHSDVYHLPWCPGAEQMNEENKVWFASRADAEQSGLRPAQNCSGLE